MAITLDPVLKAAQDSQSHSMILEIKAYRNGNELDVTPYVLRSNAIDFTRSIEHPPNRISFSVSHGHLFDPFNEESELSPFIQKGVKLKIRVGEKVNGVDYWQDMGIYYITDRSMVDYERGKYPTMHIKAEDKRNFWDDNEIVATDYYEAKSPEYILEHILTTEAGEDPGDIDILFDNSTFLHCQWIETTIMEIIEQICNRYGYFMQIGMDDKFSCRKISDSNPVDHIYGDTDQLISYLADDRFSDYTNQIIVQYEKRDFVESEFPKERLLLATGTVGWWGHKHQKRLWYSEDKKKRCKNPRLKTIESPESKIMFKLEGKVHVSYKSDLQFRYCDIYVKAPDLRVQLLVIIVMLAVIRFSGFLGGLAKEALVIEALLILGSITNYQFEIWGNPLGFFRQSDQIVVEDSEMKALTGKTISKTINETLAYNEPEAKAVGNHEILCLRLQRKPVEIRKIAHLQDEPGDTIQVKHPYSFSDLKIFATKITRRLKLPESHQGDGCFEDQIEGWVLNQ